MTTVPRALALSATLVLAACPAKGTTGGAPVVPSGFGGDSSVLASITAELVNDVLTSYERDEAPDVETGMVPPDIGGARIGVGPGDVLVAGDLVRAPSRWPLRVGAPTEARSKRLEVHVARDMSAAWVFDEISWRIPACDRTAVIPLRITMLYARDGDRWVPVFEHMSYGHLAAPNIGDLFGAKMVSRTVGNSDFVDELSSVVSPMLSQTGQARGVALGPESMLLGPETEAEWHGADVAIAKIAPGPIKSIEDRRIGFVGRSLDKATIAYWVGNVVGDLPSRPTLGLGPGKARMRVTFVFERRRLVTQNVSDRASEEDRRRKEARSCADDATDCKWVLVQGHVSQPIGDSDLASQVFGTALLSPNLESGEALRVSCAD